LVFPTRKLENIDGILHWYLRKLSMISAIAMNKIVEKYFIGIFILLIVYNTDGIINEIFAFKNQI
jgi:hypothetical protein